LTRWCWRCRCRCCWWPSRCRGNGGQGSPSSRCGGGGGGTGPATAAAEVAGSAPRPPQATPPRILPGACRSRCRQWAVRGCRGLARRQGRMPARHFPHPRGAGHSGGGRAAVSAARKAREVRAARTGWGQRQRRLGPGGQARAGALRPRPLSLRLSAVLASRCRRPGRPPLSTALSASRPAPQCRCQGRWIRRRRRRR